MNYEELAKFYRLLLPYLFILTDFWGTIRITLDEASNTLDLSY